MASSSTTSRSDAAGNARWDDVRSRLEGQRAECVREREIALADTVQSLPDEVAVTRAASLQRTIQDIDEALARITGGTYGRCVQCGTGIPAERLELRPFATTCVACAQGR